MLSVATSPPLKVQAAAAYVTPSLAAIIQATKSAHLQHCTSKHVISSIIRRFTTRPSMHGSNDNLTADATFPWPDAGLSEDTQRRLLLSQNSVTARFEAQKLWDQGYTGAKVKVGVFDTGIRADHPHVKNIRWVCAFCKVVCLECCRQMCHIVSCKTVAGKLLQVEPAKPWDLAMHGLTSYTGYILHYVASFELFIRGYSTKAMAYSATVLPNCTL